jgi:hypothetical protein
MEQRDLRTWEEFEQAWQELEAKRAARLSEPHTFISEYLFRGQANSDWKLETTLERAVDHEVSLLGYYRLLWIARPKVETFTDKTWAIPTYEEYADWLGNIDYLFSEFRAYDFFVYVRHHGFPSPLLDWSRSPYVAAFFAMHNIPRDVERVSIFVFCEYSSGGKGGLVGAPTIHGLGSFVRAHRRHYLQQSQYTICTAGNKSAAVYTSHEKVAAKNKPTQDLLWKFTLPATERAKALAALNKMNINSFSLFGDEDSLMDTIAIEEILLRKHRFAD